MLGAHEPSRCHVLVTTVRSFLRPMSQPQNARVRLSGLPTIPSFAHFRGPPLPPPRSTDRADFIHSSSHEPDESWVTALAVGLVAVVAFGFPSWRTASARVTGVSIYGGTTLARFSSSAGFLVCNELCCVLDMSLPSTQAPRCLRVRQKQPYTNGPD